MASSDRPRVPLSLLRAKTGRSRQKLVERTLRNGGRVVKVPCPDGSVTLIGIAPNGQWVAEWRCLEADFREKMIDQLARHVRHSKSVGIPQVALLP